jgi:hypothetical protein
VAKKTSGRSLMRGHTEARVTATEVQVNSRTRTPGRAYRLISLSGIKLVVSHSSRPLKPFTPLIGVWQGLSRGT